MAIRSKISAEDHKKSQLVAVAIYATVMITFVTLCTVAVTVTMSQEKHKKGFKAITVTKPISFLDTTYLKEKPASKEPATDKTP